MQWDFSGRKVVITGAAGVYGIELAEAFHEAGAALCLSDIDGDGLDTVAARLAPALTHRTDLTEEASIGALAAMVAEAWGAPDVVVNNAGIYPFAGLMESDAALWDRVLTVNLRAPFLLTQAMARLMIAKGTRGCFVMVSSASADVLRVNGVPYCVSKRGLEYLARGFALDLGRHGIRVNCVRPPFAEGSKAVAFPPGYADAIARANPLGRARQVGDLASAVLFLASDAAAALTGETLGADGGAAINRRHGVVSEGTVSGRARPAADTRR